ncbi:hypothetical protein PHYBOEH_003080 [Phytophthora boehmeriae]|uniref:Uncharacterized protein n=1 Tax=Phytophthora boehmeriae TaxID=109152 RepID=A0A8T1WQZ2_9STRA|nr:hypothetical protein PHYBOEH_003080 [Phytophthora boehmeriae]
MSPTTVAETHYELIRDAIFDNDRARVAELLAIPGVDVDHFDAGGQTLLHLACFWGRMDLAKVLLAAGASLKTKNAAGCTALDLATHWGHSAVAEVIRLRGGSSVWEDKLGAMQLELEDLTLRSEYVEKQNIEKQCRLDDMVKELHAVQTQLAEERSAHALTATTLQRVRLNHANQRELHQQLVHERDSLVEQLKASMVALANSEKANERVKEEMAALKAHRDDILEQMQESVKKQEEAAHNWQRAEAAAAMADSQRNFAFSERDQLYRTEKATLSDLLVTTERLGAAEDELMTLKTDLAEHIFEMKREQRSQKHAARAIASVTTDKLTQGSRRPTTTPALTLSSSEKSTRRPEEIQQLLQAAKSTPKKKFSLAAREYGDRIRGEEQKKLRDRVQRQQRVENQYRAHGFRAAVVDAEVFQEEFVSTVRAFASSRSEKWQNLKRDRDRQARFVANTLARPISTAPQQDRQQDSAFGLGSTLNFGLYKKELALPDQKMLHSCAQFVAHNGVSTSSWGILQFFQSIFKCLVSSLQLLTRDDDTIFLLFERRYYVIVNQTLLFQLGYHESVNQLSEVVGKVCRAAVKATDGDEDTPSSPASISVYRVGPTDSGKGGGGNRRIRLLKTLSVSWTDRLLDTALSPDGKLVSGQGTNASSSLGVWDWGRGRQIALTDVHCRVSRVRFNVIDMAQLSTSGGNLLRIWTLCAYTLKPLASFKSGDETKVKNVMSYADHAWLPDDVLVALLKDGDVQLIVNAELVQTLRAVHKGVGRLSCMNPLNNGEGVVVGGTHGLVSVVRVASKMLKVNEKELHLQRRMRIPNTERIVGVTTDPAATMLLCCTENGYGTYDLSNLTLLREDDETIALNFLSSTPRSEEMELLSAASRRPCFAASCRLPDGDAAVHVWNQMDCHECFIAHPLEQTPLSLDVHPAGAELLLTFASKIQIFFMLQDSLRLAFETQQKQLSLAQYNSNGAFFAAVHATNKDIFVYRGFSRVQREPQLVGIFHDFRDSIASFRWTVSDNSFFAVDAGGELRLCQLHWQAGGEVEDLVITHGVTQTLAPNNTVVAFASSYIGHSSHEYAVFVAEKRMPNPHNRAGTSQCTLRAWINGELAFDALRNSSGDVGENVGFEITALEAGPGLTGNPRHMHYSFLFTGTAGGGVVIFSWKRGCRNNEGHGTLLLSSAIKRVDLHTAPVAGLFYAPRSRLLLTNARNGVVLACKLIREKPAGGESSAALAMAIRDEQSLHDLSIHAFSSICQPEELAVYDRNKVELGRLKLLDMEGELQQFKMENEMLSRQVSDQRTRFETTLQGKLATYSRTAEEDQKLLRKSLDARWGGAIHERDEKLRCLSEDARSAQDHYLFTLEKLQSECDSLREQLHATKLDLEEHQKRGQERESLLDCEFKEQLREAKDQHVSIQRKLSEELDTAKKQLYEVLRQLDQDQLVQMGQLASSIDHEKQKGALQLAIHHGKSAALNQELKMLLGALTQKDIELQQMNRDYNERMHDIEVLREKLAAEKAFAKRLVREKDESLVQLVEQRRLYENLQRLDGVHRSQLELLQKHLLPKDRELTQMQEHLTQLHDANQEVVVQANISDRLRAETSSLAKRQERDLEIALKRLEQVRHSIVVLQEELGELVRCSAVQEKSTLVTEIGRLHKRITRQLDALQARGDSATEVNAELHRQNRFLLQHKHSLRLQVEAGTREKNKLAAALSFQNSSLLAELNTLRRANKELDRRLKRYDNLEAKSGGVDQNESSVRVTKSENSETDEIDGRNVALPIQPSKSTAPVTTRTSSNAQLFVARKASGRAKPRPKSAVVGRARRDQLI